ncbi:hypothetical protein [Leptotrichia wadei]|uniref:hypothetical protein n=1 Tax=Leptotrichia wadei TaxID=157687 RepID=UPI001E63641A|nr:hypothetical protein [Leptotrichia wadei]
MKTVNVDEIIHKILGEENSNRNIRSIINDRGLKSNNRQSRTFLILFFSGVLFGVVAQKMVDNQPVKPYVKRIAVAGMTMAIALSLNKVVVISTLGFCIRGVLSWDFSEKLC